MIEELYISTQKRIKDSQAANQKKIEDRIAAMASAQLQQRKKFDERLVAMALEQNAAQLRQQTTLLDEVKMLARPSLTARI